MPIDFGCKLQSEVRDLKKRLRTTEDDLKRSQTDTSKFFSTLKVRL